MTADDATDEFSREDEEGIYDQVPGEPGNSFDEPADTLDDMDEHLDDEGEALFNEVGLGDVYDEVDLANEEEFDDDPEGYLDVGADAEEPGQGLAISDDEEDE